MHELALEDLPEGAPPFSAGFLFVHGIGAQQPGRTLLTFERSLRRTLERMYPMISVHHLTIGETAESPAHTVWHVVNGDVYVRWLLVEARWSESFEPPDTTQLMAWLRRVQFWLVAFHFCAAIVLRVHILAKDMDTASHQHRWRSLALGLFIMASMPIRIVWALLWRLVLVPPLIFVLRVSLRLNRLPLVGRLALLISSFVGDSFSLIADSQAQRAMEDRIARDYQWCRNHVDDVVVVAHSQGAYLTREVLAARGSAGTVFVSLGAGIGVLHTLQWTELRAAYARAVPFLALIFLQIVVTTALVVWILPLSRDIDDTGRILIDYARCISALPLSPSLEDYNVCFAPIEADFWARELRAIVVGVVLFALVTLPPAFLLTRARKHVTHMGFDLIYRSRHNEISLPPDRARAWLDFSSEQDPVSIGLLLEGAADASIPVSNGLLPLVEHVRYHRNQCVMRTLVWITSALLPVSPSDREAAETLVNSAGTAQMRSLRVRAVLSAALGLIVLVAITVWVTAPTLTS